MERLKQLTNVLIAEELQPIHDALLKEIGPFNPSDIGEADEAALDDAIEQLGRDGQFSTERLGMGATKALMRRLIRAAANAVTAPSAVMFEVPEDMGEGALLAFAILSLHRRKSDLLEALRRSLN